MELIITTDLAREVPARIQWNNEDLKQELAEKLASYKTLVVTQETIPAAKKDRADLNRLKEAIEARRKEVKAQCLAPYNAFEASVRELTALINEPIAAIDRQLAAFEAARREKRRADLEHFWRDNIGDLRELLPLERIYNKRWENASMPLIQATRELTDAITRVRSDMGALRALGGEGQERLLDVYLQTLDMGAAIREQKRLQAQAEALRQLAVRDAADGEARREAPQPPAPAAGDGLSIGGGEAEEIPTPPAEALKTIRVIFYDTTAAFRREMKALTQRHGIRYGGA